MNTLKMITVNTSRGKSAEAYQRHTRGKLRGKPRG
jgi:hypothetical protein